MVNRNVILCRYNFVLRCKMIINLGDNLILLNFIGVDFMLLFIEINGFINVRFVEINVLVYGKLILFLKILIRINFYFFFF